MVNCIKRDRRALKTSSHLCGTLKSFEMHGKANQPLSFILLPIIRTRWQDVYSSMAHPVLSDHLRPDIRMTLLSHYSQNLHISKNIPCYPYLGKWDTNWYELCCQRFQGSKSDIFGRVYSLWVCQEARKTTENTTQQSHHSTDFLTMVAHLQVKCHILTCAFMYLSAVFDTVYQIENKSKRAERWEKWRWKFKNT